MSTPLNSRQRQYLKGLAHGDKVPLCQIGKEGISDRVVSSIDAALKGSELIKVQFLEKGEIDRFAYAEDIARRTNAEVVQVIGFKAIVYRRNPEKPRIVLPEGGEQ
jgi:RNA-binding protein